MKGTEFLAQIRSLSRADREQAILAATRAGHMPSWVTDLEPVPVSAGEHEGVVFVSPDYLAIGDDEDFVRMPMTPTTAQAIADQLGRVLPTRRIVDAVYAQASRRLEPKPLTPGAAMTSVAYIEKHDRIIREQLDGALPRGIVAGHKKDVVITNRLVTAPDRVAIYGWHRRVGDPIQPLTTVHEKTYADYSHGARLVGATMLVDGETRLLSDVLQDPDVVSLVSDEGLLHWLRYPTPTSASPRLLKLGARGPDVARWQRFLAARGFTPGPADGAFGAKTRAATIAFQRRHGLAADGVVGPKTRAKAAELGFDDDGDEGDDEEQDEGWPPPTAFAPLAYPFRQPVWTPVSGRDGRRWPRDRRRAVGAGSQAQ